NERGLPRGPAPRTFGNDVQPAHSFAASAHHRPGGRGRGPWHFGRSPSSVSAERPVALSRRNRSFSLSPGSTSDRRSTVASSHSSRDRLRGAVVGYGFISSQGHLPSYLRRARRQRDVEIIAIADICPARRELARRNLPGMHVYEDYRSLLDA